MIKTGVDVLETENINIIICQLQITFKKQQKIYLLYHRHDLCLYPFVYVYLYKEKWNTLFPDSIYPFRKLYGFDNCLSANGLFELFEISQNIFNRTLTNIHKDRIKKKLYCQTKGSAGGYIPTSYFRMTGSSNPLS